MAQWLKDNSSDSDIVISTRARIARNASGIPFPHMIRNTDREELVKRPAIQKFCSNGSDFLLREMKDLSQNERNALVEQHVVSRDLINKDDGAVISSPDEAISIMLMEEDHYRIQYLCAGFNPEEAYEVANNVEKMLGSNVSYAYSDRFGYLTACPTNLGTGLRIGVMMHLKGHVLSNNIKDLQSGLGRLGLTIRGAYGEGSTPIADCYQISNQVTLGISEQEIVQNIRQFVGRLINQERDVRNILYKNNKLELEDSVYRAYGILKNAKKMSSDEANRYLSTLSFGVSLGMLHPCRETDIYRLMIETMPATLRREAETAIERDIRRAEIIQKVLD